MRKLENIFGFVKINKLTTMYTEEQLYQDVLSEATSLRELATPPEKNNLNVYTIFPSNREKCVYGQMTGSCNSPRAIELMQKCCTQYFHNEDYDLTSLREVLSHVNGKDSVVVAPRVRRHGIAYFSSIESYIIIKGAKCAELLSYIKGETNELNLKIEQNDNNNNIG